MTFRKVFILSGATNGIDNDLNLFRPFFLYLNFPQYFSFNWKNFWNFSFSFRSLEEKDLLTMWRKSHLQQNPNRLHFTFPWGQTASKTEKKICSWLFNGNFTLKLLWSIFETFNNHFDNSPSTGASFYKNYLLEKKTYVYFSLK